MRLPGTAVSTWFAGIDFASAFERSTAFVDDVKATLNSWRDSILAAAMHCYLEQGVQGTTIDDIAAAIGPAAMAMVEQALSASSRGRESTRTP